MYKLLLCWRYLRTRYIALASVVSVMLGVATMIVVNGVMAGFSHEMQDRLHSILSDIVFETHGLEGFPDPEWHMQQIRTVAGDAIEGMTPTVSVPAMLSFQYGGNWIPRPVQLVGIDERTQHQAGDFGKYLQHPENRQAMAFVLRESGYDTHSALDAAAASSSAGHTGHERTAMRSAGWVHRRETVSRQRAMVKEAERNNPPVVGDDIFGQRDVQAAAAAERAADIDPFAARDGQQAVFDPLREQHTGLVLGIALATYRDSDGEDRFLIMPGDDVKLTFPTAGTPPRAVDDTFTIVDLYESKMSEYDSSLVFVPISRLQELRGMVDPNTGLRYATSIQIKLKPGVDGNAVRDKLRRAFPPEMFSISTWRDKQGALLAAVQMETAILNVLLFMIIAVAGFGILAIFFMIVVEKTRDIGILKSLGASGRGIMGIFLGYGLSLGALGAGVGMVMGLLFIWNINDIAHLLSLLTGQEVFDPSIYYFYQIPTIVDPWTVTWIVAGAVGIAVLASVLPARRAAALHPVEALRYE
ncbi:MAG TPA: FtsX-like permease family protein [Pirellulales bacterium]|jgi:lipoprotein-releasing system permease protein|nr:FtsX-like permease family protein [Pirellulales bacterium]